MNVSKPRDSREEFPTTCNPLHLYLAEISEYPLLTRTEEYECACLLYHGKDPAAEEKLLGSNLKLVVKIALDYLSPHVEILDLVQEGNLGLLRAVRKFDPHRGAKFSVYASFWIRAHILQYIMNTWSVVKVGTTQGERKLFYTLDTTREGCRPDTSSEITAAGLGLKESNYLAARQRLTNPDVSLDAPLDDGTDGTLLDTIGSSENIEDIVCDSEESRILAQFVASFKEALNDTEAVVFERRVMAEEPVSLREIGTALRISYEKVRHIEQKVIRKLDAKVREEKRAVEA